MQALSVRSEIGIIAINDGENLAITTTGDVTGRRFGIDAANFGTGTTTINTTTVSGSSADGIRLESGTDTSVTSSGSVQGGRHGINVI